MNRKIFNILKTALFICIVILIVEIVYFVYSSYFKDSEISYFDGINAFDYVDDYYITVGSNNNNDKRQEKAKITRYNMKKEKVWEKIFNKGYNGTYNDVVINDNDVIAVGSYESSKGQYKNSNRTALLVKYDSSGKELFSKDFKVLDNSTFTNIYAVDDGYLVTGQSVYEDMALGTSNKGGAILVKYDKEGNLLWKTNYGSSKDSIFNYLVVCNNDIYVVGKDGNVGVVVKYDLFGNLVSAATYNNIDGFGFSGIVSVNNEVIVSGGKISDSSDENYDSDALIVKYDLDCNYVSEVVYASDGVERFNRIISDDDNLVVIGTTAVYNEQKSDKNESVFTYNGIIGKYRNDLKKVEVLEYGDDADDYFTEVKLIEGDYLVSGYSSYDDEYLSKFITYSDALKVLEVK